MALLIKHIIRNYHYVVNDLTDPRVEGYLFSESPLQPIAIGAIYLLLIRKILPDFMKNRPPFKLDKILIVFNLTQVFVNAYLFYHSTQQVFKLNWSCAPIDFSDTPENRFLVKLVYIYYCMKISDLFDTVFFLLRGKTNQVSFLHVYHHFGMLALSFAGLKYFAGGHSFFLGWINTFVHTIMYFYYFLTILKPEYKKRIWWKKYITQLQLGQFVFLLIIYGQLLFKPWCTYPKICSYFVIPQNLFMIVLFSDFYWKTYIKPKKEAKQQ